MPDENSQSNTEMDPETRETLERCLEVGRWIEKEFRYMTLPELWEAEEPEPAVTDSAGAGEATA